MSSSSDAATNVTHEASNSISSNFPSKAKRSSSRHEFRKSNSSNKRPRHETNSSSSKFKGVVSQLNGHWGAQIYAKHQRIWLGTFKSEKEAAMAYDSAVIKVRSGDSFRNFPQTATTSQERNFQNHFSTQEVLNMIKDGSYVSKLEDYLNTKVQEFEVGGNSVVSPEKEGYSCRQLFQKELTPSDVGKLNRLVIPKKNALKYFPHAPEGEVENGVQQDEVQLVFYDKSMRLWKFRYCYWKSSQSYVFTRGWNKFVKKNGLKSKDTVIFSHCECTDGVNVISSFGQIDVNYHDRLENKSGNTNDLGAVSEENVEATTDVNGKLEALVQVAENARYSDVTDKENEVDSEKVAAMGTESGVAEKKKGVMLFGVQIY